MKVVSIQSVTVCVTGRYCVENDTNFSAIYREIDVIYTL